jgi:hypothetical protein
LHPAPASVAAPGPEIGPVTERADEPSDEAGLDPVGDPGLDSGVAPQPDAPARGADGIGVGGGRGPAGRVSATTVVAAPVVREAVRGGSGSSRWPQRLHSTTSSSFSVLQ